MHPATKITLIPYEREMKEKEIKKSPFPEKPETGRNRQAAGRKGFSCGFF